MPRNRHQEFIRSLHAKGESQQLRSRFGRTNPRFLAQQAWFLACCFLLGLPYLLAKMRLDWAQQGVSRPPMGSSGPQLLPRDWQTDPLNQ
uniref:Uncharacterized protein n=1 Tax=Oryza sativa subsp. japonica TaxID=39947 RepID=Q6Z175_ORYSJ|nr:hypothetical protein [Oryza sativa Japonica Group]